MFYDTLTLRVTLEFRVDMKLECLGSALLGLNLKLDSREIFNCFSKIQMKSVGSGKSHNDGVQTTEVY